MLNNVGIWDLVIRLAIAGFLLDLGSTTFKDTPWSLILAIAALLPLITAFKGFCPIYTLFGISTHEHHNH